MVNFRCFDVAFNCEWLDDYEDINEYFEILGIEQPVSVSSLLTDKRVSFSAKVDCDYEECYDRSGMAETYKGKGYKDYKDTLENSSAVFFIWTEFKKTDGNISPVMYVTEDIEGYEKEVPLTEKEKADLITAAVKSIRKEFGEVGYKFND